MYVYIYMCVCVCMVVKMSKFCKNKVLNIVDLELMKQLNLYLLLHGVTLCFIFDNECCKNET